MKLTRIMASSLVAAAIVAGPAAGIAWAEGAGITGVMVEASNVSFVFTPTNPPAGAEIDRAGLQVSIGSVPATATIVTPGATPATSRSALVVIDNRSTTSSVDTLAAVKSAAIAYVQALPADIEVGVVAAGSDPKVTNPTSDRASVVSAINETSAAGTGRLFDGVAAASETLAKIEGHNSLLVIATAADSGSQSAAGQAAELVRTNAIHLDEVLLGSDAAMIASLQPLATAGSGRVLTAGSPDSLGRAGAQSADITRNQLLITVPYPPEQAATQANLSVAASVGGVPVTADQIVTLTDGSTQSVGGALTPVASDATPISDLGAQKWVLPIAVGLIFVALAAILGLLAWRAVPEEDVDGRIKRRLSMYGVGARLEGSAADELSGSGNSAVAKSAVDLAGRVVTNRDLDANLARRIDAAGLSIKPPEWLLIHIGFAIVLAVVMTLLFSFEIIPTLLGLFFGLALPWLFLSFKESARQKEFQAQLAPTLQVMAGALAAGYSLPQAVDSVVKESSGPMKDELNRSLLESRLGVPLEDSLEAIATRMNCQDFAWVVWAIRIQRDVGGNLAEVLTNVAATIRERERLRRQVSALSAEGRLSAYVLGGLPVAFTLYLVLVKPDYIGVLLTTPLGVAMVIMAGILLLAGALWLSKIVNVKV